MVNNMFKNIGKTLFILGQILFWLFLIVAGLAFVTFFSEGDGMSFTFALCMIVSAFLLAIPVSGFGRLIQDVQAIRKKLIDSNEFSSINGK